MARDKTDSSTSLKGMQNRIMARNGPIGVKRGFGRDTLFWSILVFAKTASEQKKQVTVKITLAVTYSG